MKIEELKKIVAHSRYIVVICGSGMLREGGILHIRSQDRAYEIEQAYGHSPEEFLSQAFYSTRPEQFYEFYRKDLLKDSQAPGEAFYLLAELQKLAPVKSIITDDFFGFPSAAGCEHVIELHGNVNRNTCDKCGSVFSAEYILNSKRCPICDKCGGPIRPGIIFFGDMVNNRLMTTAATEISRADTLLMLGCSLNTELAGRYIKYFQGNKLILINPKRHYLDDRADICIHSPIGEILRTLTYHLASETM